MTAPDAAGPAPSGALRAVGACTLYRRFDGMTWPVPSERLAALSYSLRYGEPNKQDAITAAGVIDAYWQLVTMPARLRAERIREIRKGANV
jgi:hypothetical protein